MYSNVISFTEVGKVGSTSVQQNAAPKPYLRVSSSKDCVTIGFDMGAQEAILIYCQRGDATDFVLLGSTTKSPFVDNRVNLGEYAETRHYKAVFSKNDEPVGEADHIKIKTKGRFRFF